MKLSVSVASVVAVVMSWGAVVAGPSRTITTGPQPPVEIEASSIEATGSSVRAVGDVTIRSAGRRMTAADAYYNWDSGVAELKNAMFTTCTATNPDYRIEAASLTLMPRNRVRARRLAFFLGKTKVLSLPGLQMRIGGRRASADVLPRISYDRNGGFALGQRVTLIDADRVSAVVDAKLSSVNGLEGDLDGLVGIDGYVMPVVPQPLSYPTFRTAGLTVPIRVADVAASRETSPSGVARLRQFTRVSANARTYNVRNVDLLVYRQPEIGLQYVAPSLSIGGRCADDRLTSCPQINLSWGRFREVNGAGPINRTGGEVVLPLSIPLRSKNTLLQPALQYSRSRYSSGATYTWSAYSLGISHLRRDGCLAAVRYINRSDSGSTPFLFDQLIVRDELQGALQVPLGKYLLAFVAGYDTQARQVYDWSVLCGWRTDCLAAFVSWSNLESLFAIGVRLAGT